MCNTSAIFQPKMFVVGRILAVFLLTAIIRLSRISAKNFFQPSGILKIFGLGVYDWCMTDGLSEVWKTQLCVCWWLDVYRWTVTRSNHCGRHDCSRKKKHSTQYVLVFCCCWLRSLIRKCSDFFLKCSATNRKWFLEHASLFFLDSVSFCIFMVALCIFILWFLLSSSVFFFSSPNLSRRRLDVYHTSTHGVALVRI